MHLYVRADADSQIGIGHVMRCIALAQEWKDQGGQVTFINYCENELVYRRIINEGFNLVKLKHICPHTSDLEMTITILNDRNNIESKWVVLDGYHFTSDYQISIRNSTTHLLVIDDMNHLKSYHADIILNNNIYAPKIKYNCENNTTCILGTEYILLRNEFYNYLDYKRNIPDHANNILVSLGGADPKNMTLKIIEILKQIKNNEINAKIIIGPENKYQDIISKSISSARFNAELIINPKNMPELMAWADLAISYCGTTVWEYAFMGLPSCIISLNPLQENIAMELDQKMICNYLGSDEIINYRKIHEIIENLIVSKNNRIIMSKNGKNLVNIEGRKKVINKLKEMN